MRCTSASRRGCATRRGGRLKGDEAALFDGSFMLGERALEAGLIDGFADIDSLVRRLGGDKARARVQRPRRRGLLRPAAANGGGRDARCDRGAELADRAVVHRFTRNEVDCSRDEIFGFRVSV